MSRGQSPVSRGQFSGHATGKTEATLPLHFVLAEEARSVSSAGWPHRDKFSMESTGTKSPNNKRLSEGGVPSAATRRRANFGLSLHILEAY